MDPDAFDRLTRIMSRLTTRRLAVILASFLWLGGLAAAPDASEAGKKGKKKRKKRKKKKCKKQRKTICNGTCGIVKDKCKKKIDCGACQPTCAACQEGECCTGDGACGACLAFVSSTSHDGDFDGLSGADGFCQGLAAAAGLPGEYKAWLSDSTGSPSTRFVQATVPYTLVDGATIANSWSDLIDGTLATAIDLTELGAPAGGNINVWTNTLADGTPGGFEMGGDCVNWTINFSGPLDLGNTGARSLTTDSWTKFSHHECSLPLHLYCFQQR